MRVASVRAISESPERDAWEKMLGLYFMRQLMDEVRFRFDAEGNELTMVKRRCR